MNPFCVESTARALAAQHPEAALPCPICAASLRGQNLERHLTKVHPTRTPAETSWTGIDHTLTLPLLGCGALTTFAFGAVVVATPLVGIPVLISFAGVIALLLVGLLLAAFSRVRATVQLHGDELRLRHGFGLRQRRLRLPPRGIEVGGLLERRTSPIASAALDNPPHEDVRVGTYLRLIGDGGSLTLGSKTGTGFRRHWDPSGWVHGGTRRRWDVTLDPRALVAIEYYLADRGLLTVRGD